MKNDTQMLHVNSMIEDCLTVGCQDTVLLLVRTAGNEKCEDFDNFFVCLLWCPLVQH